MAAIASISLWRPRDGKLQDFMARVATAKKIHERIGGTVRVWQSQFGGQPLSVGYVIETESWEAFGQFGAKLEQDSEWQQFWTDALQNSSGDLLENSVVTEIPL
jgi:hypothetical protein